MEGRRYEIHSARSKTTSSILCPTYLMRAALRGAVVFLVRGNVSGRALRLLTDSLVQFCFDVRAPHTKALTT